MSDMVKLASISLSSDQHDCDKVAWKTVTLERFSVKAAYKLANSWTDESDWEGWRAIWRMKIQQQVKIFVWLMANGKLMTNSKSWRRKLEHSPLCVRCGQLDEEVMHAIRDSAHAKDVWVCLVPSS